MAAQQRQLHARAPGTWANYRAAIRGYKLYCHKFGIQQLSPTPLDVRCWIEELVGRQCPSSVANTLSHLRLYLRICHASLAPLDDVRVRLAMDAVKRSKEHKPKGARAAPLAIIKQVLQELRRTPRDRAVAFAIMIMYYTGARQSEVAPRSAAAFDHTRHTTRSDIRRSEGAILLHKKWAKNLQSNTQSRDIRMIAAPAPELCPVRAYRRMLRDAPTTRPDQPLLVFPADGATITAPYIASVWKSTQARLGVRTPYTLHAIRKAAATVAFASGNTELEVRRFGGWASNAHRAYIETIDSNKVNRTLVKAITTTQ